MTIRKGAREVLASLARTATPADVALTKENLGVTRDELINLHVIIDVTAINLTPSITVDLIAVDAVSGSEYTLLTSAAITTVSTNVIKIGKDTVDSANVSAQTFIPKDVIVRVTHGDADSITYSVGIQTEFDAWQ